MNTQRVQSLLGRLELLWFGITRVWRLFFSIPSEKNSFLECFLHLYFLQDILFYSLCALCFYGWFYTLCLIVWCKALCNCLNTFHCFCLFLAQVKGSHKVPETISMYSLVMWANTSHRKAGGVKKKNLSVLNWPMACSNLSLTRRWSLHLCLLVICCSGLAPGFHKNYWNNSTKPGWRMGF